MSEFTELLTPLLLDDERLVRAVAGGRRRGAEGRWRRVEVRYVDLSAGRRLQVTSYDDTQAFTDNHADAAAAVAELAELPFTNWHVETTEATHQLRITKKGKVLAHRSAATREQPGRSHDRAKERLLAEGSAVLRELGLADERGRIKPSRQAKYRQVEEFVRALSAAIDDGLETGALRRATDADPLRVVDLGCGNAYLTFAALAHLTDRGIPVRMIGVDVKQQSHDHNSAVAERLGWSDRISFVVGDIASAELPEQPDVVLALHACDTATDDALARALAWEAGLVLAAPCCHHDLAAQLRSVEVSPAQTLLLRDGILRERLADTLTDAVRAAILRTRGYRADVVEFVPSEHTPRNTLLRAVRTGVAAPSDAYDDLVGTWHVTPRLATLLER